MNNTSAWVEVAPQVSIEWAKVPLRVHRSTPWYRHSVAARTSLQRACSGAAGSVALRVTPFEFIYKSGWNWAICIYNVWLWNSDCIRKTKPPLRLARAREACAGTSCHCPEHFRNQWELACSRHYGCLSSYFCTDLTWTPVKILESLFPPVGNTVRHKHSSERAGAIKILCKMAATWS